jgi:DNA-binding response OmpR family regulator
MAGSGPSILIVNGDGAERAAIAAALSGAGLAIETSADEAAGLAAIAHRRFDAAVIAAPDAVGGDFVRRARRHCPELKLLFVVEPWASRVDDDHGACVMRPLDARAVLRCLLDLLLRGPAPGERLGWRYAAECGIAAAELACLDNRRAAAQRVGAGDLAADIDRRISATRALGRAQAGLAEARLATGQAADY